MLVNSGQRVVSRLLVTLMQSSDGPIINIRCREKRLRIDNSGRSVICTAPIYEV